MVGKSIRNKSVMKLSFSLIQEIRRCMQCFWEGGVFSLKVILVFCPRRTLSIWGLFHFNMTLSVRHSRDGLQLILGGCFLIGTEENDDSQRRDRILRFFLHLGKRQHSTFWGNFPAKLHRKKLKKQEKSTSENSKKIQWRPPWNCRFLSLVVVESNFGEFCQIWPWAIYLC